MAVPKYNEIFPAFIKSLADGEIHSLKDIRDFCAEDFKLSDEDKQVHLASGQNMFNDRVGWARTYLKKAGLIDSPARAKFCLTAEGKKALQAGAEYVTLKYLQQNKAFSEWYHTGKSTDNAAPVSEEVSGQSPQEMMNYALDELNSSVADDLMSEVLKISPYDFEHLIVKLLIKMGYGSMKLNKDATTQKSGDEGIDGIVTADKFGFDSIYAQAKQWKIDSVVGRPEVQKFLGALAGQGAAKGLFITTARFSKEAKEFANKQLHSKIVLVDGAQLMKLMIEYNLGVSTVATYEVKRIDYDFFNEEV